MSLILSAFHSATTYVLKRRHALIAVLTLTGIAAHLILRTISRGNDLPLWPLWLVLLLGGVPLTVELAAKAWRREFGSDLLAGVSIVTATALGEYLAGALVVLMLSGGETLEAFAVRSASRALEILANRMPSIAHRRQSDNVVDVALTDVRVGDELIVFPHEVCPADGTVVAGHSSMDESYLTGEPYVLSKTPGSAALSGAINGEGALTIRVDKLPVDSRYAKIVEVMRASEQQRPNIRRLGDQLGAIYTPIAILIALIAWTASRERMRFLAVLVVATPCPLLIGIPVAILGAISLAAKRGIIVKNPVSLEQIDRCRTAIFDKTGTLTYGKPQLVRIATQNGFLANEILMLVASLERYSKHPLATAILQAAHERGLSLVAASSINEKPGCGLSGRVSSHDVTITGRKGLAQFGGSLPKEFSTQSGMECMVIVDGRFAAAMQFRDEPRGEGRPFVAHLGPKHAIRRLLLVSGDRESEVRHLAARVGINEVYSAQTPEQKLDIVRHETARVKTVFLGDGINDAPALAAATVGIAIGQNSDVTAEAADAVILDSSLAKIDEFMHIGRRMRRIALESAVGGMALSVVGMFLAAAGYLPPVAGALTQEAIDVAAIINALRMALPSQQLTDF